jgi:transposase InsO family protein
MRQLGIQGAHLHKHWKTTRQDRDAAAAPDLVDRNFTAVEPNRLWVADLTYVKTLQGNHDADPVQPTRSAKTVAGIDGN